jgi:hypothetical protein
LLVRSTCAQKCEVSNFNGALVSRQWICCSRFDIPVCCKLPKEESVAVDACVMLLYDLFGNRIRTVSNKSQLECAPVHVAIKIKCNRSSDFVV